jgi:IS30 family transposase
MRALAQPMLWEPNGLLRQYLPKDTELATYTHDEPDHYRQHHQFTIADRLDNRPRATPNWQMAGTCLRRPWQAHIDPRPD